MRRILSVWSPNWPITSWRLRNSGASAEPFGLVETVKNARRLSAVSEAAGAAGLWAGQKLADALALEPGLKTADADPAADLKALIRLADACARFSPAVAVDAPEGLFLDVTGGAHLWGGEPGLLQAVTRFMGRQGAPVRLGLADTAGAAWALARFGEGIAPPGGQAALLADLPVEALRVSDDTAAALRRLGLKTIGQVAALPRAEVARRFEPELLLRLDQALGRAEEALSFRRAPEPWIERRAFFEPLSALDDFARVTADLAEALCRRLAAAGQGGRRFEAVFHRVDGRAFPLSIGTALPNRTPARLVKLLAPKLETVDPGFGVEVVTLAARRVEPLAERQGGLAADQAEETEEVAALIDRLSNRLGEARVWRAAPEESHAPERAVARASPAAQVTEAWDLERPRPLRLLRRPEPIEAMAPVPDDPPVVFTWRGVRRRVRRAEGPERIAQEWWRDAATEPDAGRVRDYYAVEDADGGRFWLFRAGLYAQDAPTRWYLHGLFG